MASISSRCQSYTQSSLLLTVRRRMPREPGTTSGPRRVRGTAPGTGTARQLSTFPAREPVTRPEKYYLDPQRSEADYIRTSQTNRKQVAMALKIISGGQT